MAYRDCSYAFTITLCFCEKPTNYGGDQTKATAAAKKPHTFCLRLFMDVPTV